MEKGKGKANVMQDQEKRENNSQSRNSSRSSSKAGVQGTLYDAVAGRLSYEGYILDSTKKPVPPDQVLFSRKDAPIRYQENDVYFANRNLPAGVTLPDSDLLKAIHAYASDYYGSGHLGDTRDDFCSMDETALLAMGILLEEAARHALGKTGDLAFVQGEREEGPEERP
ncbi:Vacuolar -sorting-associated 25 [Lecanosticta acicola]|uniref:Vacuolar -sorting-associated 25 n=1 Tax=Lecanosticta acicola TaxID=111012 RepID=A0AAI8Z4L8_9PEZI|nr:Vacuolar -sorting-associated 25 [Lecanosticta acicola]